MGLSKLSTADLEAELAKRKKQKKGAPAPLDKPDFTSLIQMIVDEVEDQIENGVGEDESDFDHMVYEAAMEAVYGPTYFEWFKAQTEA